VEKSQAVDVAALKAAQAEAKQEQESES